MLKLKLKYTKAEEIPAGFEELFTEKDGAFIFDGIEGDGGPVKTAADVARLQTALTKEREAHKGTKAKLHAFGDLTPEALEELRGEVEVLKAAAEAGGNKPDQAAIDKLVEARAEAKAKPLQAELKKVQAELATVTGERDDLTKEKRSRSIVDAVRAATVGEKGIKVQPTAMADIELLAERVFETNEEGAVVTRDQAGFVPGLTPRDWLAEVQTAGSRSHWFPASEGAGAQGGAGSKLAGPNPFQGDKPNMTQIAKLIQTDPKRARALATQAKQLPLFEKLAGSTAGA